MYGRRFLKYGIRFLIDGPRFLKYGLSTGWAAKPLA